MKTLNVSNVSSDVRDIISHNSGLVKKTGIFGSLARGTFNAASDIDILIEYDAAPDIDMGHFTRFCELCNQIIDTLTGLYGRDVDLIHFEGKPSNNLQDENVEKDVIWL